MTRIFPFIAITLIFSGCSRKHLDEKIFRSKDITVKWYRVSEITTIHDFVDIERWGWTKRIMEANTAGIYDVSINNDTVIIQVKDDLLIYELAAKVLNCHIKVDKTITFSQYSNKFGR
jgi:hypothetical protein